ncbi:uncharacterized protein MONBRDRAFT_32290 [Monosiga brevicollis MX1]|uniref:Phospholipid/glycerol acyltransferase domain-containing protein n=1 Tax=Monosiga brevicollis TaxID=81824 RepID=A9UYL0_MONBE|nr:uncharacterized protein MONBRDRAFT_32290 [Monosiga brevicollis MX1]EDQ89481.1 predicted protein [Monosiga brevicollis MX1]|eukprot:XP_001745510.1 hypothetical protein [Monosiga brevicollis MX1]
MALLSVLVDAWLAGVFFASGLLCVGLQILTLPIWVFSRKHYRLANSAIVQLYWTELLWMLEQWSGCRLVVYGKDEDLELMGTESSVALCNHVSNVDWLIGWLLADKFGVLGGAKCLLKKDLAFLPVLGWSWWFLEYTYISRNWEKDEKKIHQGLSRLQDYPLPFWEVIYAEGTRKTPEKHAKGLEFCRRNNLPEFQHVMYPRTKGYVVAMEELRKHTQSVLCCVLAFPNGEPNAMSILSGSKACRLDAYVWRVPIEQVPADPEGSAQFCVDAFATMDKALAYHAEHGCFEEKRHDMPVRARSAYVFWGWSILFAALLAMYQVPRLLEGHFSLLYVGGALVLASQALTLFSMRFEAKSQLKSKVKKTA